MNTRFLILYGSMANIILVLAVILSGRFWAIGLDYETGEDTHLLQLLVPIFLGYLSSAVVFATSNQNIREPQGNKKKMLNAIVGFGFAIFFVGFVIITIGFYFSSHGFRSGQGVTFQQYSGYLTVIVTILHVCVTASANYLFLNSQAEPVSEEIKFQ